MTVKCLKPFEQRALGMSFKQGIPINDLATFWDVSRRTVIRVLEDQGIDPKIHRRNRNRIAKAETVMELFERAHAAPPPFQIPHYSPLAGAYTRPSVPWYVRVFNAVRQFFSPRTA